MGKSDVEKNEPDLNGSGLRIGIVVSRFNPEVGEALLAACTAALTKMANTGKYDALIALGAVIRGETYHFEIVANESAGGITTVGLDTGVPVANGILTTDNDDQAAARVSQKG